MVDLGAFVASFSSQTNTVESYLASARRFLKFHDGRVDNIQADSTSRYVTELATMHPPGTVQIYRTGVMHFLAWLRRHGHTVPDQDAVKIRVARLTTIPRDRWDDYELGVGRCDVVEPYPSAALLLPLMAVEAGHLCGVLAGDVKLRDPINGLWTMTVLEQPVMLTQQASILLTRYVRTVRAATPGYVVGGGTRWLFPDARGGHIRARTLGELVDRVRRELGLRSPRRRTRKTTHDRPRDPAAAPDAGPTG